MKRDIILMFCIAIIIYWIVYMILIVNDYIDNKVCEALKINDLNSYNELCKNKN